jgi:predicted MPP superfamily phosphohydrolase
MAKNKTPILSGIKHEIDTNGEPLEILALADLHIGDKNCNMDLINNLINGVKNTPNRYAVLIGDLMNTAIAGSKSDVYNEILTPQEQLEKCVDLLKPIKNKILAIVPGNHEERITRQIGFDVPLELAHRLDLESMYNPTSALVFVKFGHGKATAAPLTYVLYLNHGHGGGRRPGGKLNSLQDYALIVDADCYIVGHTHLPASFKASTYRTVPQRAQATLREQLFVNTASALNYGGYGKRGGYQPTSNSYPIITLDPSIHHMTVTL